MTDTAITEAELDRLELLLDDPSLEEAMRLDEMQGFICAALTGPEALAEEDRLVEILGEDVDFESPLVDEVADLVARFSASIEEQLASDEGVTLFLYPKSEEENAAYDFEPWCAGYLHGVDAAAVDWFDDLDEEEAEFLDEHLFPLMVLSGEAAAAAEDQDEDWPTGEEGLELERDCEEDLPLVVGEIFRFWQAKQGAETVRRDGPKVGRNDPCPCGSGRKYKHCCGRPA